MVVQSRRCRTVAPALPAGRGPLATILIAALFPLRAVAGAAEPSTGDTRQAVLSAYEQQVHPFLKTYCATCHNAQKHKGDVDFESVAGAEAALAKPALWKTCAEKLATREMPPEKERKQPSDAERGVVAAWVRSVRRLSPRDPGVSAIRRLSRAEYANSLHDLLGCDPQVAAELPADVVGEGYNNSISPLLMEKYLLVADEVLDQLIKPDQLMLTWRAGQLDAIVGAQREEGRPDGAERRFTGPGEVTALIPAPVDGTYTIRVKASAEKLGRDPAKLAVRIDGQVVGELKITAAPKTPAVQTLTIKLAAGKARLSLLMANPYVEVEAPKKDPAAQVVTKPGATKPKPPTVTPAKPGGVTKQAAGAAGAGDGQQLRIVTIEDIEVLGPPGALASPAQRRLLVAMPGKDVTKTEAARRIAQAFARRAFRRPPAADEIEVLMSVFALADSQDEVFTESVKLMMKAVLVSPQFLFITADDPPGTSGEIVPLGDHQLASRLSYLLWATMPDDELSALADDGRLHQPALLAQQVRRLIADPRSHALFDGFGAQWLGLDRLAELQVDEKKFPLMTKDLRKAMYAEASMLFETIMREDRPLGEFIDCDYTFVNGLLAKVYGLDDTVKGPQFRKVQLIDGNRGGVLTMPGVMAVTSLPNRTSPVKRGRWVLEQILGQNPPPPPMNVPPLEKQNGTESAGLNLRKRTERHREDPACNGCHRVLDPIGFGLENFDAIGRWRDRDDTGGAVDATGELPGKAVFRTPQDLKKIIGARKDDFCRTLSAKLLAYALCRHLEGYDEVVADEIAAATAKDGYRFQSLITAIVTSYPFLNRHVTH